jgi:ABC-type lipoprotein release transport system permease subunit
MGAVATRIRAELRSRWKGSVALAAVIAIALGVVLAAAAGARRTQTAYPRFLREGNSADVLISPNNTGFGGFYDRVQALPQVERMAVIAGLPVAIVLPSGRLYVAFNGVAGVDHRFGTVIERPNLIAGHAPDPGSRTEVLVSRFFADRLHVSVGDRLRALVFPSSPSDPTTVPRSEGIPIRLRIAGIIVTSTDVVPANQLDLIPTMLATPAFYRSFPGMKRNFDGAYIGLRQGTDIRRFESQVRRIAEAAPGTGGRVFFANQADQTDRIRRAILPEAAALALFALLAGLASFLAISQLAARQLWVDGLEHPTLRALGMTRRQLVAVALTRVALVAGVGAVVGVAIAAAASPLFPIGPARLAETHPGFAINLAILGGGLVVAVVLLVGAAAIPAWRTAAVAGSAQGVADRPAPPSRVGAAAVRAGLPVSAATGVRMAVEPGRGRTAVPVRSALTGLAVGIAAVVAAATFGTNLDRLVNDPTRYGWNWDAMIDLGFAAVTSVDLREGAAQDPDIATYSAGVYGTVTIEGIRIPGVGIDPVHGKVYPTLIRGRNPTAPDEIVLGATSVRDIHSGVGRTVTVRLPSGTSRTMHVVGEAVFPTFGQGSFTPTSLGDGAEVVASNFPVPEVDGPNGRQVPAPSGGAYNFALVRFRSGADVDAATGRLRRLLYRTGCPTGLCDELGPTPPSEIASYRRVVSTPILLSGLLALLAAALMVHVLVTSVRRRRRDIAVLKTLGFSKRQIGAAVAWQATTLAAFSLGVGIPLGIATGRWAWTFFAERLGVGANPTVPLVGVLLAVLGTLFLANLTAAFPARSAARTQSAALLRTE